jgi:hypothetical protein
MVANIHDQDNAARLFLTATSYAMTCYLSAATLYFTLSGSAYGKITLSGTSGVWKIYTMVFDGSETGNARLKAYSNGTELTLTYVGDMPATLAAITSLYIGYPGEDKNHWTPENILYSRTFTTAERNSVTSYLGTKYNITVA